jgi:hypothetical protein
MAARLRDNYDVRRTSFYEQEVVKAFSKLTHESSAKCPFTSSPETPSWVKGR